MFSAVFKNIENQFWRDLNTVDIIPSLFVLTLYVFVIYSQAKKEFFTFLEMLITLLLIFYGGVGR